jgi:hypothetical protein
MVPWAGVLRTRQPRIGAFPEIGGEAEARGNAEPASSRLAYGNTDCISLIRTMFANPILGIDSKIVPMFSRAVIEIGRLCRS